MIKNILVSIDYEIKESYNTNYGDWDKFIIDIKDILNYYKLSIYNNGKIVLNKKIGNVTNDIELTDLDNNYLSELNIDNFINNIRLSINKYSNTLSIQKLYDQLISIILGECIVIFKCAQINECKNLNIKKIKLITDDIYSCDKCKTYSKFIYDVNKFNLDIIHPYCKISILPICDKQINIKTSIAEFINAPIIYSPLIKSITTKLMIQLKSFITNKKFVFKDNINFIEINNNDIYISNNLLDKIDIEGLIVKELLKDKLEVDTWWESQFNEKKSTKIIGDNCIIYSNPFINTQAQSNYKEYFMQCYIYYILHPSILQNIDNEAYNKIKGIFNKEFIRG